MKQNVKKMKPVGIQADDAVQNPVHQFQKGPVVLINKRECIVEDRRLKEDVLQVEIAQVRILLDENDIVVHERVVHRVGVSPQAQKRQDKDNMKPVQPGKPAMDVGS